MFSFSNTFNKASFGIDTKDYEYIKLADVAKGSSSTMSIFIIHSFFSGQGEGRKSGLETRGPPPPSETRLSDGRNYGPNPKGN